MTVCIRGFGPCQCQPDEGVYCPSSPDIANLQKQLEQAEARIVELESGASNVVELFDRITGEIDYDVYALFQAAIEPLRDLPKRNSAWLLRQRAEAVENFGGRVAEGVASDDDFEDGDFAAAWPVPDEVIKL